MSQERQVKQVSTHVSPEIHAKLLKKAKRKRISMYRLMADILEAAV